MFGFSWDRQMDGLRIPISTRPRGWRQQQQCEPEHGSVRITDVHVPRSDFVDSATKDQWVYGVYIRQLFYLFPTSAADRVLVRIGNNGCPSRPQSTSPTLVSPICLIRHLPALRHTQSVSCVLWVVWRLCGGFWRTRQAPLLNVAKVLDARVTLARQDKRGKGGQVGLVFL